MRSTILLTAVALVLGACSLCPDGTQRKTNSNTFGFGTCQETP